MNSVIAENTSVLGVPFRRVSLEEAVSWVDSALHREGQHFLITPNPEFVVSALRDPEFLEILKTADLSIPDGVGMIIGERLLNHHYSSWLPMRFFQFFTYYCGLIISQLLSTKSSPVKSRVAGSDFFLALCKLASSRGYSVFFLGAREGVAKKTASYVSSVYPDLIIAGAYAGDPFSRSDATVRAAVGSGRVDILFVAYGHNKQEKWIHRNLKNLNVGVAVGVGGAFDFYSSGNAPEVKRAPRCWQAVGLEWLWRLLKEPRKRFRRVYNAVVCYPALLAREIILRR